MALTISLPDVEIAARFAKERKVCNVASCERPVARAEGCC